MWALPEFSWKRPDIVRQLEYFWHGHSTYGEVLWQIRESHNAIIAVAICFGTGWGGTPAWGGGLPPPPPSPPPLPMS
jgi:hypothetical protein